VTVVCDFAVVGVEAPCVAVGPDRLVAGGCVAADRDVVSATAVPSLTSINGPVLLAGLAGAQAVRIAASATALAKHRNPVKRNAEVRPLSIMVCAHPLPARYE
jgi:hypothetical protein